MATVTRQFPTSGMHCHSCAMLIQMEVADLDGVESVAADPARSVTEVSYDADVVSPADIVAAITKAGYEAEVE
jgi:copper chaperone